MPSLALSELQMNIFFGFLLLLFISSPCVAQQAEVVKFDRVQRLLEPTSTEIQVINFWATWCAPCVKELPLFEKLTADGNSSIKVTLVNLDYADKVDKVNAFLKRKNIRSDVLLLDEIDYNSWIDKVDKSWGGAIPATLIINPKTGQRKFLEKELKEGDLEKVLSEMSQ
jgi:thiol-disulfide isomerase/thioredoxin